MVTTGSLRPADTTSSPLLLLLRSFFLSVLDPSSLSLLPVDFSFSLLCFLEKKQRSEILFFFLPLVSPGYVVPPLFLCPVFSVQDEDNGDRTRYCWLMDQNFPWFYLSSSSPGSVSPSPLVVFFSLVLAPVLSFSSPRWPFVL